MSLKQGVRLICEVQLLWQSVNFNPSFLCQNYGCDLYASATYMRRYTVMVFIVMGNGDVGMFASLDVSDKTAKHSVIVDVPLFL